LKCEHFCVFSHNLFGWWMEFWWSFRWCVNHNELTIFAYLSVVRWQSCIVFLTTNWKSCLTCRIFLFCWFSKTTFIMSKRYEGVRKLEKIPWIPTLLT
jgi:hypothetical protein